MIDSQTKVPFAIAIHGGAGTILKSKITPEKERAYRDALIESLFVGYNILASDGIALDAVQKAVNVMEDSPLFNAGKGAVFTHDGQHEQDACVMDGATRNAGAVAIVRRIKNPIDLARLVMEKSSHVLLAGEGAEAFAQAHGMEFVDNKYFFTEHRWQQLQEAIEKERGETRERELTSLDHSVEDKAGTVGAVALDRHGNLAAATSSGGMTNKRTGRIGDTPMIGAGTYADNATCAVSATGVGEFIMRALVAYDIATLMKYKNMTLADAANEVVMKKLTSLGGKGGAIAIDRFGNIAMPFNSEGMYRGYRLQDGEPVVRIFKE
ncbi:MAG: isoaspartyl peptidase/L-asparaginase family protein [Candidatus Zixiibacteriota bacterium]